jgi:clan AA aspartic protease
MGHVNAKLTLKNFSDVQKAKKGQIHEGEIRQEEITALVDTGATTLIINKDVFTKLGLDVIEEQEITFANDTKEVCKLTEPVYIYCDNRHAVMQVLVSEGITEFLLGVLPLESMDLIVDTVHHKLVGAHGDRAVYLAK